MMKEEIRIGKSRPELIVIKVWSQRTGRLIHW